MFVCTRVCFHAVTVAFPILEAVLGAQHMEIVLPDSPAALYKEKRKKGPAASIFRWTLLGLLSSLYCSVCSAVTNLSPEPSGRTPSNITPRESDNDFGDNDRGEETIRDGGRTAEQGCEGRKGFSFFVVGPK